MNIDHDHSFYSRTMNQMDTNTEGNGSSQDPPQVLSPQDMDATTTNSKESEKKTLTTLSSISLYGSSKIVEPERVVRREGELPLTCQVGEEKIDKPRKSKVCSETGGGGRHREGVVKLVGAPRTVGDWRRSPGSEMFWKRVKFPPIVGMLNIHM
ncbi:hypothetical protein CDAR_445441 [Caerostris darwini]|uniref:Uncharacterized protein n=1 Tax=Caerostris darwini TaxID=1538125 RepID=A0AAV4SA71_9ARAC|nr:hypothetical protein CDAR_445441 [Caerostris darwini]